MLGKLCFNVLNGVLLILGLAIAFLGFFTTFQGELPHAGEIDNRLRQSSLFVGIFGLVLVVTAIIGFIGVNRHNRCLIAIYTTILGLAEIAFIACGIFFLVNNSKITDLVNKNLQSVMVHYYAPTNQTVIQEEIDQIQKTLKCCGVSSNTTNLAVFGANPIPKSCCENGASGACTVGNIYPKGCDEKIQDVMGRYSYALAGLSFACAVYCMLLMCLAIVVRRRDYDYDDDDDDSD